MDRDVSLKRIGDQDIVTTGGRASGYQWSLLPKGFYEPTIVIYIGFSTDKTKSIKGTYSLRAQVQPGYLWGQKAGQLSGGRGRWEEVALSPWVSVLLPSVWLPLQISRWWPSNILCHAKFTFS